MTVRIADRGKRGFLLWVKHNQPGLYEKARGKLPSANGMSAFGAAADPAAVATPAAASDGWADSIKNVLTSVAQVYLTKEQAKAQNKILDLQLARAQAGQPPLDIDPVRFGVAAPQVNVGVEAATKKMLIVGAGALAVVYVLAQLLKGRRA